MLHLSLLPASSLDLSVLVVILAGTLVLFYLCEVFGWPFGGLVVPGYLASVLIVAPSAAITVFAEALLTVAAVAVVSDLLARTGAWTRFFGRERFLLIVVMSILVRQSAEVWLWPWGLQWVATHTGTELLPIGDAHSVGLVLVPLTANALSRGGLGRGLIGVIVPTLVAWVILRDLLLPATNVSLGAMTLAYQDPSLDFLRSAHAYFILATGAWVASQLNGTLAWSAGGILIPTLLGLSWFEPWRIAATLAEAIALAIVYRAVTSLPVIRHWNVEGARKLAVLVVLSTGFRIGIAWLHHVGYNVRTDDVTGLGYLLSALVALKILQYGRAPTVLLPAVGTSLAAFVGGSAAAWVAAQVIPTPHIETSATDSAAENRLARTPEGVLLAARERVRTDPQRAPAIHLPAADLARFRSFWHRTEAALAAGTAPTADSAPEFLTIGAIAAQVGDRPWVRVTEAGERPDELAGWGSALLRVGGTGPMLLWSDAWSHVPRPDALIQHCLSLDCAGIFVAGVQVPDRTDDALAALRSSLSRPMQDVAPQAPAAFVPETPQIWAGDLVAAVLDRPAATWSPTRDEMSFLEGTLVPALGAWAEGKLPFEAIVPLTRAVGLEAALTLGCGEAPCLLVTPTVAGPIVVVRPGNAAAVLVEAPHPHRELGTARIALGAFDALGARALVLDTSEPLLAPEPAGDPLHAVHLGWHRTLGDPATALLIRGLGQGEPGEPRPTEPAVVGTGRPVYGAPPAALVALLGSERLGGTWPFRWAASGPDEKGLVGNHLHALQADLALEGVTPAVAWVSGAAREAWRGDPREALSEWLGVAGLALPTHAAADLPTVEAGALSAATSAQLDALGALARRAAHQHNLNLVRRLIERAHSVGATVEAGWDANRQLAWLGVNVREGSAGGTRRAWIVQGDDREVRIRATASPEQARAALGWMPADLWAEDKR